MALTAVLPGLFPSALVRDTVVAPARDAATTVPRLSDAVVFSSAPFRLLADLATTGLRQLATLLPSLEQAVEDGNLVPLGHLAKAANAAARQVGDGHLALLAAGPDRALAALPGTPPFRALPSDGLRAFVRQQGAAPTMAAPLRADDDLRAIARQIGNALPPLRTDDDPEPDPAERWLSEAKHLLRRTGETLTEAVEHRSITDPALPPSPQIGWAMAEIVAARAQVSTTLLQLDEVPVQPRCCHASSFFSAPLRLEQLAGAVSVLGIVLFLALLAMAAGAWSIGAGILALGGTAYWAWRIGRAAQGFRLDGQR